MKKLVKILAVLVVLLIVVVFIASFFIGDIIKKGVETAGPEVTKVPIKLDGASLSLLGGSGSVKGLFIGNPEGYKTESAVKVGKAHLAVSPGSLMSDKVVIKSVRVESPELTIEGTLNNNNLTQIQKNIEAFVGASQPKEGAKPENKGAGKKLQVDEFVLTGTKVNVALSLLGGKPLTVTLPDIKLSNLGSGPDGITAAELANKVTSEVLTAVIPAVTKAVTDLGALGGEAVKGATKILGDGAGKATKGIGDLFKKKE